MSERRAIYLSDARWGFENVLRAIYLRFREILGLIMIIVTIVDLYRFGMANVDPMARAVSLTFGAIGVFIFILSLNDRAALRAWRKELELREIEIQKLEGVQEINEKNLRLFERELNIKKAESGVVVSKLDMDSFEHTPTGTTMGVVVKQELSPDMIYQTVSTQRQKEEAGLEWKSDDWWKKFGKGEYRKIKYNGRKEFFKFFMLEHMRWRKDNPERNPTYSPTTIDLTNA